jgi:hypothetical protein
MTPEKRRTERIPILGSLRGEIMRCDPLAVVELGPHGALIETGFPLRLDSLHELRISLGERSVVVLCRVVHSRISDVLQDVVAYRSGVEFLDLPAHVERAIAETLAAIVTDRHIR